METTLGKVGLSKDEITVYSTIVKFGSRTIGQIQSYCKLSAEKIKGVLSNLVSQEYVKEIKAANPEGTNYYIPLPPQIKLTGDVAQRMDNELKSISDEVDADWQNAMKDLRAKLSNFHQQLSENSDQHRASVNSVSKQFLKTISNTVDEGTNDANETKSKISEETKSFVNSNTSNIDKSVTRIKENISSSFETTIQKVGEFHDTFKLKIEETYSTIEQEHYVRTQSKIDEIKESLETVITNFNEKLNLCNVLIEGKKVIINESTDASVKKLVSEIKKSNKEANGTVEATISKTIDEYKNTINDHNEKVNNILSSLNDELKGLEQKTSERIKDTINSSKDTAVNVLKENEEKFVELLNNARVLSVEKLGALIAQTEGKTTKMKTELSVSLSSYIDDFQKNSDSLLALLKDGIDEGFTAFETGLGQSISDLSTQITTLDESLEVFVTNFIKEILSQVEELSNDIIENLKKSLDDYTAFTIGQNEEVGSKIEEMNMMATVDFQETIQASSTKVKDAVKILNTDVDDALKKIKTKEKKYTSSVVNLINKSKDDFLAHLSDASTTFNETTSSSLEQLSESIDTYKQNLSEKMDTYDKSHSEYKDEFISHLKELKETVESDINQNVNDNKTAIKDLLTKKEEQFITDFDLFTEEYTKKGRDIRDEVPNLVQINYQESISQLQELKEKLHSTTQQIHHILEAITNLDEKKFRKLFDKNEAEEMIDTFDRFSREIPLLKERTGTTIDAMIQTFTESMESLTTDTFSKMNNQLDNLSNLNDTTAETIRSDMNKASDNLDSQFSESLKSMQSNIRESYTNYENAYLEMQKNHSIKLKDIIGSETENISEVLAGLNSAATGVVNSFKELEGEGSIPDLFTNFITDLSTLSDSFITAISTHVKNEKAKTKQMAVALNKDFSSLEKTLQKKMGDVFISISNMTTQVKDKAIGGLESLVNTSSENLSNLMLTSKESSEQLVNSKKQEMKNQVEESIQSLEATKAQILSSMTENNAEVVSNVQGTLKTNIDEHSELVQNTTSSMDETMKTLQAEFESVRNTIDTEIAVTLEEASTNYSQHTAKVVEIINELVDQEVEQFSADAGSLVGDLSVSPEQSSQLDEVSNQTKSALERITEDYPTWMQKDVNERVAMLKGVIDSYKTEVQGIIDDLYLSTSKDVEKTYDQTKESIEKGIITIQEEHEKENKDYQLNVSHQINSLVTNSDSNSAALVTNIQSTRDNLLETASSVQETTTSDIESLQKMAKEMLEGILETIINKLLKLNENALTISSSQEKYTKNLSSFKESYITGSLEKIEILEKSVSDKLKLVPLKLNEVLEATAESMKLIQNVLTLGKGIEPSPAEDLWIVTGTEQVNSALMGMLRHTKGKSTIVCPDISWVDISHIETFNRSLEVLSNEPEIPGDLKAALERREAQGIVKPVTVKKAPFKALYLGVRDGVEEGVIGSITKTGEPILMVTLNEILVEAIGKMVAQARLGQL